MKYIYVRKLNDIQLEQIFELLCEADKEFVPHLSARNSTTQKDLDVNNDSSELPYAYFDCIKGQSAILAMDNDVIVGFVSDIEEYSLEIDGITYNAIYASTAIVDKEYRGRGIYHAMFEYLFSMFKGKYVICRTWSTNEHSRNLFNDFGFEVLDTVKDDRGVGIDTIYYGREIY